MKRSDFHPLDSGAGSSPDAATLGSALAKRAPIRALLCALFRALLHRIGDPPIEFSLADGEILYTPRDTRAVGRVVFSDPRSLWDVLRHPELAFGDVYCSGDLRIEGKLPEVLFHLFRSTDRAGPERSKRSWLGRLPRARNNSLSASRAHIHAHYDLGNDFYALWLDSQMVYTCAYFEHPQMSLEEAQTAKFEHVCRKLELRPGMKVVEAGCGWGALALHMAEHHGVTVRAFNISSEQLVYAREQARQRGLQNRVEFIEDDYRNVHGECDAFVSIGMLEHVGKAHYAEFGEVIARTLRRTGRALLHGVGRNRSYPPNEWLERRIFPGSYPPSLRELMDIVEPHRFVVTDVENLRLHYAKTLLLWLERFDSQLAHVREMYDENFVRAWRLYLAGCAASFRASSLQLYQLVLTCPDNNDLPMTRRHLYQGDAVQRWTQL